MTDDQVDKLAEEIRAHGNNIAENLVLLKKFLDGQRDNQQSFLAKQQEAQQAFLAEQRAGSDKAQALANRTAMWATFATALAALGAVGQLIVAVVKP